MAKLTKQQTQIAVLQGACIKHAETGVQQLRWS